jgi:hypothetical protein
MSAAKGFVVLAGGGKRFDSPTPGRSFALKLLGRETNQSIMMFEETLPAGTASLFHLHRDSDEGAWALTGEFTFMIGNAVTVGGPGPAHSCRATFRMPGKTPAAKPGGSCFSTPRPPPAASSRRSRSTARSTRTNTTNSSSATAGKSSAQTRFEATASRGALTMRRLRCDRRGSL